jgi:hypothetical protein
MLDVWGTDVVLEVDLQVPRPNLQALEVMLLSFDHLVELCQDITTNFHLSLGMVWLNQPVGGTAWP